MIDARLAALVRYVLRGTVYRGAHPATLTAENPDGTVDVRLTSDALAGRGLTGVRVRTVPGAEAANRQLGMMCLVTFEGGDPRRPSVVAWEGGTANTTTLADGDSAKGIARDGDLVELTIGPTTSQTLVVLAGTGLPTGTPISVGATAGMPLLPAPGAPALVAKGTIVATTRSVLAV